MFTVLVYRLPLLFIFHSKEGDSSHHASCCYVPSHSELAKKGTWARHVLGQQLLVGFGLPRSRLSSSEMLSVFYSTSLHRNMGRHSKVSG